MLAASTEIAGSAGYVALERVTGTPQVALTDYQLRWSMAGHIRGVATFYLEPSRLAEVELALPPGMEPLHFKVAGLPAVGRLVAEIQQCLMMQ